jgi:hypothetical protein
MSARKKKPPSKPSNAYLISFGDTMTAMLAFFIVLNSLAQEQTGANLHSGTGSFVTAINSMGLPGMFSGDKSKRVQQMKDASPRYIVNDQGEPVEPGNGPDDEDNGIRVLDRDADNIQRVMVELEQQFDVTSLSVQSRAVSFDLFDALGKEPGKTLPSSAKRVLAQVLSMLAKPGYRLEIKLWSPTPANTAIVRTANSAQAIADEVRGMLTGYPDAHKSLRASSGLWGWSDQRRPIMTIVVIRDEPADTR